MTWTSLPLSFEPQWKRRLLEDGKIHRNRSRRDVFGRGDDAAGFCSMIQITARSSTFTASMSAAISGRSFRIC